MPAELTMPAPPLQRILAGLLDWVCILGWLAVAALIGVPLHLGGVRFGPLGLNVVAMLVGVVPVTVAMSLFEAGRRGGTPGKRWRRLRVVRWSPRPSTSSGHLPADRLSAQRRIGVGQSLLRNVAKIGVPWTLGHVVAIALVGGLTSAWVWVLTVIVYALVIGYLVTLFVGDHRTPYDRLAATTVVQARIQECPVR